MRAALIKTVAIFIVSMAVTFAYAQKTTEQFIPLGKSPGVSGVSSYIGKIVRADPATGTLTMIGEEGSRSVEITQSTKIWLDRSAYRLTNVVGTFGDLEAGRQVEVKPEGDQPNRAEWVKVVPKAN